MNKFEKESQGMISRLNKDIRKKTGKILLYGLMGLAGMGASKAEGPRSSHTKEGQASSVTQESKEVKYTLGQFFDFSTFQEGESIYGGNIVSPFGGSDIFVHDGKAVLDMSKAKGYGYTAEVLIKHREQAKNEHHMAAVKEFLIEGLENTKFGDHNPVFVCVDNAGGDPSRATRVGTFIDLPDRHTGVIQVTARKVGFGEQGLNDTELFTYPLADEEGKSIEIQDGQPYAYTIETYPEDKQPLNTVIESKIYEIRRDGTYRKIGERTVTLPPVWVSSKGVKLQTPGPGNAMFGAVFSGSNWKDLVTRVYMADREKESNRAF